jgi:apolipoprotein D and lipocalin family protein
MVRGLVLGAALAVAIASSFGCGTEPPLDVAPNVDLGRFQGKWYEVARLPRTTQTDCYGTTAFYTMASGGSLQLVHQCNVGSNDGPLNTVTMTATVPNGAVPAKLALDVGTFSGDYWILEVGPNYEYAVVGHPSRAYFWILSRTPALDTGTVSSILERAQKNHFDTSQLQFTPQPPSGERVSSNVPVGDVPPAVSTGCSMSAPTPAAPWPLALAFVALLMRRRKTQQGETEQERQGEMEQEDGKTGRF